MSKTSTRFSIGYYWLPHNMTDEKLRFSPHLGYDENIGAHLRAQGIDTTISAAMLSVADAHDGLFTEAVISRHSINELYGIELEQDFRLTVDLEPVEDDWNE